MARRMRIVGVTFATLMLAHAAQACSRVSIPTKVGSDFGVRVSDRGRPIVGIQVKLDKYNATTDDIAQEQQLVLTDYDGTVRFSSLEPGQYFVSVQRGSVGSDRLVEVGGVPEAERQRLVEFEWPGRTILKSQTVSGRLSAWLSNTTDSHAYNIAFPIWGPLKEAALVLLDANNGQPVWKGATDNLGRFMAPGVKAGLYILEMRDSRAHEPKSFFEIDDGIPIEVSPDAALPDLDVELTMTSCGLSYTSGCPEVHLTAQKACGSIVDNAGAAVEKAAIRLYGVGSTSQAKTQSDMYGNFDLGTFPLGEYRLVIERPGFTAAKLGLTLVDPSEDARCEKRIQVLLAIAGSCSGASLDKP